MHPDLKRQARKIRKAEQRKQRRADWAKRLKEVRCFWSRPFGHEYVNNGTDASPDWWCVSCDKAQYLVYLVNEDELAK